MEKLKKILEMVKDYDLRSAYGELWELIGSTAFVVSKCPKCGSADLVTAIDPDERDLELPGVAFVCRTIDCGFVSDFMPTPAEAAATIKLNT